MLGNNQISISSRSNINISLCIYYCGSEDYTPKKEWGPKVLDHYILYYVYDGKGTVEVDKKKFKVQKGQGFLIIPNTLSKFKADEKDPFKIVWVAFYGFRAGGYLSRARLDADTPVFTLKEDDDFIFTEMKKMLEDSRRITNRYCRMMSSLYLIVSHLIDISNSENGFVEGKDSVELYMRKALEYVDMNYSTNVTVQEMAEYVGIDRKYLYHIFNTNLDKSPQKYLIEYRMYRATELLKNGNLTVSDVASSIGYSDPFHFSKIFKKNMGMSPSAYRKTIEPDANKEVEQLDANSKSKIEELQDIIQKKDTVIENLLKLVDSFKDAIKEKK